MLSPAPFKPKLKKFKKIYTEKIYYISENGNFLYFSQKKAFLIFLEMELFYILGNGNPEKNPYISGNGNPPKIPFISELSYIPGSGNLKKISYISGSNFPSSKSFLYFRRNFQSPKNLLYFSKQSYENIFRKTLSDKSFHLFCKVNQKILLVYKNIESFLLC